jgi:hypothetical protein
MSLDVFFQGFIAGESSATGSTEMLAVLAPYVRERRGTFLHIQVGDGGADLYLNDDGMMANHVSGQDSWDLLVAGAMAANWVILPLGCPTCLTGPGQRDELPEGLDADIARVGSGADLRAMITPI